MRSTIVRIIKPLLIIGLLMPAGVLLAAETHAPATVRVSGPNWYDVEQAQTLLNQMQTLAGKVQEHVAPIQVQEGQLNWGLQASCLNRGRYDINRMGKDLLRLDATRNRLEPWQRNLVHKITPDVHEMVYQMDAAIKKLNTHQNRMVLGMTRYPQNINLLYESAGQVAGTIQAVTQSAHAEQKMAALKRSTATATS